MACQAMMRELYFVKRYPVEQMHTLFWGHYSGLLVVLLEQSAKQKTVEG